MAAPYPADRSSREGPTRKLSPIRRTTIPRATIVVDRGYMTSATAAWVDHVHLVREMLTPGERSALCASARRGEFVGLFPGVYLDAALWQRMTPTERYRARVKSASLVAPAETVFSHLSAASLWRLPLVGAWPKSADVLAPSSAGGRSTRVFQRHTVGIPEEVELIEGLTVTTLARTAVDVASRLDFLAAVTVIDATLRRTAYPLPQLPITSVSRADLTEALQTVPLRHGRGEARLAVEFADGAADRPGESVSRVNMHRMGCPMPELQVALTGASGRIYIVDFWWPQFHMVGEFDGDAKYTDPEFLRGRTPERALLDEKLREDDLRAAGHGMCRWRWATAMSVHSLHAHLLAAGIR